MNNRSLSFDIPTATEGTVIRWSVRYAGKPSYDGDERQGYWLSVMPQKVERRDGYVTRTTQGYSGAKSCLQEATRYNARVLREFADKQPGSQFFQDLVQRIMDKHGLAPADGSAVVGV